MKCVEMLEGANKGDILRVPDETAVKLVVKDKTARYVPKSRYKAVLRGNNSLEKGAAK